MEAQRPIAILGGGIAGLAAGLSARDLGLPFQIFERSTRTGGNCLTFCHDGFRFDSGAHRLHDRDGQATAQLKKLLGKNCRRIDVPSQIRHRDMFLAFPFKVGDLAAKLGWPFLLRVAGEILGGRWQRNVEASDFAARVQRDYGRTLARLFLLNYSEKLWGLPAAQLAPEIAGNRLDGLNLLTILRETFGAARTSSRHLEGPFYYPDNGIGAVSDSLAGGCGAAHIRTRAQVSRIWHDGRRMRAIEINRREEFPCSAVVSSMPLDRFLHRLDPPPPAAVLQAAAGLRFRQLALAAFFLDRETVSPAATLYFPDPAFPFTRIYEPKNRSPLMAPPGRTSLVAEIPYGPGEPFANMDDGPLLAGVRSHLAGSGLIADRDILAATVRRLDDAYPVLEKGVENKRQEIFSYLNGFANLKIIGRNGTFRYLHIHQLLPQSARAVSELSLLEESW